MCFVVLLAYSFIVFVISLPLRPLSEIKIRVFLFSRKDRRERKVLFPLVFHACAGVVANFVTTRVRREFYPPPPPCGVLPLSQG